MRYLSLALSLLALGAGSTALEATTITVRCGQSRPCAGGYNPYNPASYNSPRYYGPNAGRIASPLGDSLLGGSTPSGATHLVVRSGGSINVYKITSIDPDCRSRGPASVRLLEAPRGGQASVVETHDYVAFAPGNPRAACNRRKVAATEILYRASPGFVGEESFAAEIVDADGVARTRRFNVEVR